MQGSVWTVQSFWTNNLKLAGQNGNIAGLSLNRGIREHARVRMNYDVTEQGITQNNDKENTIQYIGEFSAHLLIKLYCTHCPKNNLNLCKKNAVCHGWNGFHDGRYLFTYIWHRNRTYTIASLPLVTVSGFVYAEIQIIFGPSVHMWQLHPHTHMWNIFSSSPPPHIGF